MSESTPETSNAGEFSVDELIEPIAIILDSNGIGDKATNAPSQIV